MPTKNIFKTQCAWYAAIALLLFAACTQRENKSDTDLDEDGTAHDTVSYSMNTVYAHSPYIQMRGDELDTTFYRATFPLSEDDLFNDLIFQALHVEDIEDIEQSAQLFLASYNDYVDEAHDPERIHPWFQEVRCDVYLHTPNILVLRNQTSEYTGGAHPNYFELFYNYDLNKLELITLKDLFDADKTKEILNIAEKYFREQEGLDAAASLGEDYFFDNGVFTLADNFVLSRDALIFQYNPYEIKPYAEGLTTISISYSEIEHLLTESGKAYIQEIKSYNTLEV